jgi:hypothetical protein
MPVGRAAAPLASTWEIGTAGSAGLTAGRPRNKARPDFAPAAAAALSASVPHSEQPPQRPAHLTVCQPQSLH